jgi:uncharacterized membrane protein
VTHEGIGFPALLGLLFIGLKLGGVIDWSWWWVLCPLWGPLAVLAILAVIAGIIMLIFIGILWLGERRRRRRQAAELADHARTLTVLLGGKVIGPDGKPVTR